MRGVKKSDIARLGTGRNESRKRPLDSSPALLSMKVAKLSSVRRELSAVEVINVEEICSSLLESHQDVSEDTLKSICRDIIIISHDR